ncbi:hypothetical protein EB241_12475 [Erwinia psidii]|uniref:Uncharacterized protein n=1 Tax=Erwinia psidii TaxID=69224 RepID=A0A3N6SDW6_9GAMM|nr:hypothetical protein EB241_12475 [Erwinia psidii]
MRIYRQRALQAVGLADAFCMVMIPLANRVCGLTEARTGRGLRIYYGVSLYLPPILFSQCLTGPEKKNVYCEAILGDKSRKFFHRVIP